jgi:hypothetical protein
VEESRLFGDSQNRIASLINLSKAFFLCLLLINILVGDDFNDSLSRRDVVFLLWTTLIKSVILNRESSYG